MVSHSAGDRALGQGLQAGFPAHGDLLTLPVQGAGRRIDARDGESLRGARDRAARGTVARRVARTCRCYRLNPARHFLVAVTAAAITLSTASAAPAPYVIPV